MKTTPQKQPRTNASVLIISLIISGILCLSLLSYLSLVNQQNVSVARSQAWNVALAAAEAGIEEGMAQINVNFGTNNMGSANANGWSGPSGGIYGPKTTTITPASYTATIDTTGPFPAITAVGKTTVPASSQPVFRTVRVTTTSTSAFTGAMVALQNIGFNGNNIAIDSYDSADPAHSTPQGTYNLATRKAGGDVTSTDGIVNVGNANVNGKLRTGPTGSYSVGPNGFVGPVGWTGPGVYPGWYVNDFNMNLPDVSAPYSSGLAPGAKKGTNTYTLGTASYYYGGNFNLKNNETLYVGGNATFYVTGNFTMQSQNGSYITIAPGATLKLYVGGVSSTFTQVNNAGNAYNFQYFGLPSNTSMSWSGNAQFMGTVYAPEAQFTLSGGGNPSNNSDYQGACVVQSVVMNGHFNFHYDENLKRVGPISGFTVASWREL